MASKDNVVFSIVFKKGRAEKNRLPLEDVIATLQQIQQMIRDCGRQIQRDAGIENPDGDFGIELLAGKSGLIFQKGSLETAAAITNDIPNGILAINTLIDTTDLLEKRKREIVTPDYAEPILRRLPRVSEIQRENRTELHLVLSQNRQVINSSKLGQRGRETLKRLEAPELGIESITLYGRLRELRDKSRITDEENRGHFWGELQEDSGRIWRIRFKDRDEGRVLKLFRKQVEVTGNATYFRTQAPRVDVAEIDEDAMPDYLVAYGRFNAAYRDIFRDRDTEDILDEARG